MKIASLQIENVKRVKALRLEPSAAGLTVLGGKNAQGKTSVLDAIAAALGGAKYVGSNLTRDGAMNPASIRLTLDNGLVVERKGKNAALTVTDPTGARAGQKLLDSFVSEFSLDLPKFLNASTKEKANILLETLGIGPQLKNLDDAEKRHYDERTAIGRIALSKQKHAEELPEYPDAPDELVSVGDLIKQHQSIVAKNGENENKRRNLAALELSLPPLQREIDYLKKQLAEKELEYKQIEASVEAGKKSVKQLKDESTAELEASIENVESINAQISANIAKRAAADEAAEYQAQYDTLTEKIETCRASRLAMLKNANLPLPELTIDNCELVYRGQRWDCMSAAEQLMVSVAICKQLKPECGFVLMDKLEQMDTDTMNDFGAWLVAENLQVIATRVTANADECTLIIEDGLPKGITYIEEVTGVKSSTPAEPEAETDDWERF